MFEEKENINPNRQKVRRRMSPPQSIKKRGGVPVKALEIFEGESSAKN
jgi:hypothetical protein